MNINMLVISFILFLFLVMLFCMYMLYRNEKTYEFCIKISKDLKNKILSDSNITTIGQVDYYYDLFPKYSKILWSFKSFKPEIQLNKELYNYIYG